MSSCEIKKPDHPVAGMTTRGGAILLCLFLLAMTPHVTKGEQLEATVELFTELLPFEKQERLENFQMDLEEYFLHWEWVEEFEGPPIPFTFRMYLTDESVGFEDRYGARIHTSNEYDLQYLDKDCHFSYQRGERLEHDAIVYHPLTGLLDYYAYLIIGGEMDKWSTLGGDAFYKAAREVVQEAQFSEYYRGWNQRSEVLERILADENLQYRKMTAVYFRALALWENDNLEEARQYGRSALAMVEAILAEQVEDQDWARRYEDQIARFFEHHYREIADLFADAPQGREVFELLMTIDPKHNEFYGQFIQD